MENNSDILKIILSEEEISTIVSSLAEIINNDYKDKKLLLVGLLKGSFVFLADIMRKLTIACEVDFMAVSSYGSSTQTSGSLKILKDLSTDISKYDVLIVEDIVDSGVTLSKVIELLKSRNPLSLRLCSLLSKPERRLNYVEIDYLGTEIADEFVVGYGLDFAEKYRGLPYICVLKPEVYQNI